MMMLRVVKTLSFLVCCGLTMVFVLSCTKDQPATPVPSNSGDTLPRVTGVKSYLALGDSYTIGQSVPAVDRFPVQLVSMLRAAGYNISDPEIVATTGWTTGNLLEAIRTISTGKTYDVVSVLIGVNNQYQGRSTNEYSAEFTELLNKAIKLAGNQPSKVVVISIPDYSVTPYAARSDKQLIAAQIDAFNKINKDISDNYKVNYVDVTPESRKAAGDPGLVASDGLHFSGKEYRIWAELMLPAFKSILK